MNRWHLRILAFALAAAAIGLIGYKTRVLGYPLVPAEEVESWVIEARLGFEPDGRAIKAELAIPADPPGFMLIDENFVSRGYGVQTERRDDNRVALWSIRRATGQQALYYRATVARHSEEPEPQAVPALEQAPEYDELEGAAVQAILDEVRSKSADIATFSSLLVKMLASPAPDENVQLLLPRPATREQQTRTAIHVLAGARIPARMVWGIHLAEGIRDPIPEPWLEVNNGERWIAINPADASHGYPPDFLIWWHGDAPLFSVDNARHPELKFSVTRSLEPALEMVSRQGELVGSPVMAYSLSTLPVHVQNVYRALLLIPIGILLIVVLRNVIGIRTFGTFMPVLISLAFRETDLGSGVLLFSVIVTLGLSVRFYLEHLKLLLVPRLAVVVIVVIMLMLLVSLLSHRLEFDVGLSVALFPMVIMAMTIERISIVWEEHGPGDAITQAIGSLLVAIACYLAMYNARVEYFVFVFPEVLLLVLAITLMLGRYTGYRLSELLRFRALGQGAPQ
ncbi:inactive transglutaminase family protein [Marilutibacter chinensis]|uniref:Inactive transglutaminase family protein n=1 Tax=Marilutibacter chinensis TaxID=2912247 RepID=A0ABS9HTE9_9GAMM|nr:inactive transglutaminase family protein [Lysobacter chinensis]MCF7221362.1 inactive transglutaminase family protein [Lysobacter chinensis]